MVGGSKNTKLFILLKKNFLTSALTVEPFVLKTLGTILVQIPICIFSRSCIKKYYGKLFCTSTILDNERFWNEGGDCKMEIANCTYLCKPNNCFALGEEGGFGILK